MAKPKQNKNVNFVAELPELLCETVERRSVSKKVWDTLLPAERTHCRKFGDATGFYYYSEKILPPYPNPLLAALLKMLRKQRVEYVVENFERNNRPFSRITTYGADLV